MRWILSLLGVIAILLGGLWLVQGLGLVTIGPILCVAECETLEGPAPGWVLAGAVVLALGAGLMWLAWGRARR